MLEINNLQVRYKTDEGDVHAVEDVDFQIGENETVGLVGESGCGKTTLAKSIIKLLSTNGMIEGGSVRYKGQEISDLTEREIKKQIRWKEISIIPQNAMSGFDPVYTVGEQIVEVIQAHEHETTKKDARERAMSLFERLGIDRNRIDNYPHQFSGGMAQRAMIALALCLNPSLVLADEPTTALDVVIQDQILNEIRSLQDEFNMSMILITHDMSVVSETCDRIAVMYGGRIVEYADAKTIIKNPRHPYTLGLKNSFPDISKDSQQLISIPGVPPNLIDPDEGCQFAPRCPFAEQDCWEVTPKLEEVESGHKVHCHRADEVELLRREASDPKTWLSMKEDNVLNNSADSKKSAEINPPEE